MVSFFFKLKYKPINSKVYIKHQICEIEKYTKIKFIPELFLKKLNEIKPVHKQTHVKCINVSAFSKIFGTLTKI